MSLRARLIAGLLVLAAVGLVTLGAVTYAEQRSFLMKRVDQEAKAAIGPISGSLDRRGANVSGARPAMTSEAYFQRSPGLIT